MRLARRFPYFWIVPVAALAVYLFVMCRHLYWGDSAEFVLAAWSLGVPHPTGYPLFVLIGRIATLLPFGAVPFRVNLISSLAAALSVLFVGRIVFAVTQNRLAALLSGFAWAFSYELFDQATRAEVYSMHALMIAVVMFAAIRSAREPSIGTLGLLSLALGLSFANHMTTVLMMPPVAYYLYVQGRGIAWKKALPIMVVCFVLPWALYLSLPLSSLRNPPADYDDPQRLGNLYRLMSGQEFRYRFYLPNLTWLAGQIGQFLWLAGRQYYHGLLLVVYGIGVGRRNRRLFWFLVLVAVFNVLYTLLYNIPDKEGYYLPAYLVMVIFGGLALDRLVGASRVRALLAGIILLPILLVNLTRVDRHQSRSLEDISSVILAQTPRGALLFIDDVELYYGVLYAQSAGGLGEDRTLVCDYLLKLDWYVDQLRARHPALKVDPRLAAELRETEADIARLDPVRYGQASKEMVRRVKSRLIADNLETKPVCIVLYDDRELLREYGGWQLANLGLVYRVTRTPSPPAAFALSLPGPSRYNARRLRDKNDRYVALRFAGALNRRGIINTMSRDYAAAIKDYNASLQYDPDYSQVYKNLGLAYIESGDTANGRKAWQRLLELAPDDDAAGYIRAWLAKY